MTGDKPKSLARVVTFCAVLVTSAGSGICQTSPPAASPAVSTATAPGSAAPSPGREKETKETKESKETRDHPSDLVGIVSAVAWPASVIILVMIVLLGILLSETVRRLFGVAVSAVRKIEIAGTKLEIDTSVVDKVKECLGSSPHTLVKKAKGEYDKMAAAAMIDVRLRDVVRRGLREILRRHALREWPADLRATVHVPDIVFKDYLYQLVEYYPGDAAGRTAGRRFSQRYGVVGRAWRLGRSVGSGTAVSGPDAASQLIMHWGMQPHEADDQSHLRPANLCIVLVNDQDDDSQVGLLYMDSTAENAFGVDRDRQPVAAATPPSGAPATPPPIADDVAEELQNHELTKALARAVGGIMAALRSAGPALDVTDLRYENEQA
jgi:hypothetical protein